MTHLGSLSATTGSIKRDSMIVELRGYWYHTYRTGTETVDYRTQCGTQSCWRATSLLRAPIDQNHHGSTVKRATSFFSDPELMSKVGL
jgi:hypothetical protein